MGYQKFIITNSVLCTHVMPLVPAAFAVISTDQPALGPYWSHDISVVNADNSSIVLHDIHGRKRKILFCELCLCILDKLFRLWLSVVYSYLLVFVTIWRILVGYVLLFYFLYVFLFRLITKDHYLNEIRFILQAVCLVCNNILFYSSSFFLSRSLTNEHRNYDCRSPVNLSTYFNRESGRISISLDRIAKG
jgi:cellulose synthase/poly-beta-1,6-N-acetylglucosamine synthase-like glycosyltransferase